MNIPKDEAISKLEKVRDMNIQINHIDRRITEFRSHMEYPGMRYTDMPKPPKKSYKVSAFSKIFERIEALQEEKTELLIEIDILMESFFALKDLHFNILVYKYVNEYDWQEISQKTGYSKAACERFEREAFEILNTKAAK